MHPAPEPLPGLSIGEQRPSVTCRLCGRPLRDRAARTWALGPECREKLRIREAPTPPAGEVEQDTLPGT